MPSGTTSQSPPLARLALRSASPWSTLPWAYAGPLPLRPRPDAQLRVSLHRVLRGFVPPVARQAGDPSG